MTDRRPIVIWKPHRHDWKSPLKKCPCRWIDVSQQDHPGLAACNFEDVWTAVE